MSKALLLATLITSGHSTTTDTTTNVLSDYSLCPNAIEQVLQHHGMKNYVYSPGKQHAYAKKTTSGGSMVLKVDCKELKE